MNKRKWVGKWKDLGAQVANWQFSRKRTQAADSSLKEADLTGANCTGVDFRGASFSNANLQGTILKDSMLIGADFRNADIRGANLEGADVTGVRFNRKTRCRGIRVSSCFGSQRFKTFAQDQDYIEEFKDAHPVWYWLWLILADCGRSFWPWACWSAALALSFAALFFFILGPESFKFAGPPADSFQTMIYYSVVTFTTLGFGDVTPVTKGAMWAVMAEVVLGYIMLGGLISILANKLARRSWGLHTQGVK